MRDQSKIQIIDNLWIPVSGGRKLAARLWLPDTRHMHPTILEYLPYAKRHGTEARDQTTHAVFVHHGYACLRVDIAGTGDSEGRFDDEYSEQELSDGEEVINWITQQNWSDGKVGMIGISWGGFNGLQLAYRQPPALKAVVSVASTADRYADDIHYMGGCLLSDNAAWAAQMLAYLTRPADPLLRPDWREDWFERLQNHSDLALLWQGHASRDHYWQHGSICEDFSKIEVPVLAMTGWADAYVNTPAWIVENVPSQSKAIIGPWEHRYAHIAQLGAADFHTEVLTWFDHWLKGLNNDVEHLPDFRSFCQEFSPPSEKMSPPQGRWIAEQSWPSENIKPLTFCLNNDTLSLMPSQAPQSEQIDQEVRASDEGAIVKISNPADLGKTSGYFCAGMRIDNELCKDQAEDDALSTCFDLVLEEDLEILGRPELDLTLSIDQPVAQIVARLCEVDHKGVSKRISYRAFNINHYAGHDKPQSLEVNKLYKINFLLNMCSHKLKAGHRLRLALSTSYWPIIWPSPKPVEISLQCGLSRLHLPVREVDREIPPLHPMQPFDLPPCDDEILREPKGLVKEIVEEDGRLVKRIFDDFGERRSAVHGLITGSYVETTYAINPDDPTSASISTQWNFAFKRDSWEVEIHSETNMTSDDEAFYVSREVYATEGAAKSKVFHNTWHDTLPRGFL